MLLLLSKKQIKIKMANQIKKRKHSHIIMTNHCPRN